MCFLGWFFFFLSFLFFTGSAIIRLQIAEIKNINCAYARFSIRIHISQSKNADDLDDKHDQHLLSLPLVGV